MILMRLTSAGAMLDGQVDGVVQGAVDAEPDPQLLALRLDVDVRGPVPHRLGDDQVDHLDDRGVSVGGPRWPAVDRRMRLGGLEGLDEAVDAGERAVRRVDRPRISDGGAIASSTAPPAAALRLVEKVADAGSATAT